MPVGDLLEWLAAAALVTSAYLWSGDVLAFAVGGACLAYFAQCHSGTKLALRRPPRNVDLDGNAVWRCNKCGGEHHLGLQAGHVCRVEA